MKRLLTLSLLTVSCEDRPQVLVPWGEHSCALVDLKYNNQLHSYEMEGWNPIDCPPNPDRKWTRQEVDKWNKTFGICSRRLGSKICADDIEWPKDTPAHGKLGLDGSKN